MYFEIDYLFLIAYSRIEKILEVIMSKKYYAVRNGRKPGIYRTWDEAKNQVDGFSSPVYKSFKTLKEAEMFMAGTNISNNKTPKKTPANEKDLTLDSDTVEAYVDGSFHKASNRYSFGIVLIKDGEVIETLQRAGDNPKYQNSWQIAGEVFGSLHAIHWAIKNGYKKIIVYYDYLGIEKWALGEWRTNKPVSMDYAESFKKLAPKIDIEFVKVKAHSGVEFNELADQLAKDAFHHASSESKN